MIITLIKVTHQTFRHTPKQQRSETFTGGTDTNSTNVKMCDAVAVSSGIDMSDLWTKRTDVGYLGRQAKDSPWFRMLSIDGEIKLQLDFDTICLAKTMEAAAEAKELSSFAKQVKSGITYLAPTATVIATAETIAEHKATGSSAPMGMIHNARWWLSCTPMEGVPEGQLTPTCQSRLARDQPQQPVRHPQ